MAELRPFATAKQAADIGGITPTDIGVSATAFVRKSELVKAGKFDETSLASYQDTWFVNLDAVKKVSGGNILHIEWLPFDKVAADATEVSTFVSCQGSYVGDPVVTVTDGLKNVKARIESYTDSSGWTHRIFLTFDKNVTLSNLTSVVTVTITDADGKSKSSSNNVVQEAATFTAEPMTLSFEADDTTTQDVVTIVCPGSFTVSTDSPSWISFSKQQDSTVKIYMLAKNTSGSDRSGKVIITYDYTGDKIEVEVVQKGAGVSHNLEVSPTSMNFNADSTSGKDITITATGDWTIE